MLISSLDLIFQLIARGMIGNIPTALEHVEVEFNMDIDLKGLKKNMVECAKETPGTLKNAIHKRVLV